MFRVVFFSLKVVLLVKFSGVVIVWVKALHSFNVCLVTLGLFYFTAGYYAGVTVLCCVIQPDKMSAG